MKKLMTLIVAAFAFVLPIFADTETVDGIEWNYTLRDGEATIYNGGSASIPTSTTGAITIPLSLGDCPVTSIGEYAFYGCSGLTSVTIPDSVTSIGDLAFYCCSGLLSLKLPDFLTSIGVGAFSGCSGLTILTMPESVTNIGSQAFCNCSGLSSMTIPDSVTSIGDNAFAGFGGKMSLMSFVVGESNPNYKVDNGLLLS